MFAISVVNYFTKNLGSNHFSVLDQILRYLANCLDKSITFGRESKFDLIRYSDFDWIRDHSDKKSASGFVFTLNRRLIRHN